MLGLVSIGIAVAVFAGVKIVKQKPIPEKQEGVSREIEQKEEEKIVKSEEKGLVEKKEVPAPQKTQNSDPEEVQKTKEYIANLKEVLAGDPGRLVFICGGNPCLILTQRFETQEDGYHLDCGGLTLAPAPETKVGAYIKADNITIENCLFDGFDTGIEIEGSGAVITKNTIKNSLGNGILVKGKKAAIFENTIEGSGGAGIFVAGESNEHAIADNAIKENGTQGFYIGGAGALTVFGNKIFGNKSEGVWLAGNARDNILFNNNVTGNSGECGIFLSALNNISPGNNTILENTTDKQNIICL